MDTQAPPCRNCGSTDYYTTAATFGGEASSLLPLGFWTSAQAKVRICGRCGLVDWFLTDGSLKIVRDKFEKGGSFAPESDPAPEPGSERPHPTVGRLAIKEDLLTYTIHGSEYWRVPIADLRVIGEYTDESGPGADDYFFTFLTATEYFEALFYVQDRDAFLAKLGSRLGHELRPGLCDSTTFASRILWPAHLEGQPVFDFAPEPPADNLFGKLGQQILPHVERRLTEKLLAELEAAAPPEK